MTTTSWPNLVYVFADDLGYGDVRCNNPDSKIPTPNLEQLANRGMRFTDAHASASLCSPSRYSLLTGRNAWRSRLQRGIVMQWDGALIEPQRLTVASFLRDHGYRTSCFGKWHLGWDWPTHDGGHPNETLPFGRGDSRRETFGDRVDFSRAIPGGPTDHGFERYFGVDVPNFPPYAWFADDRLTAQPCEPKPQTMFGEPGPAVPGWSLEAVIPELARRTVTEIEEASAEDRPFFVYLPLTSPHTPIVPNDRFLGSSGIGPYGDFVCELDWVIGEVIEALERTGTIDNTIVIFASDNGPERETAQDEGAYQRVFSHNHFSMGPLRGIKRDAWEGGHRIPLLISWPDTTPAGAVCDQTVGLVDLMATCAELLNEQLPADAAEDSVSMLPLLEGKTHEPTRRCLVTHTAAGNFAIRQGDWILIDAPTGDENGEPDAFQRLRGYQNHEEPGELFNLTEDLPQRHNRYHEEADRVRSLRSLLQAVKHTPRNQASKLQVPTYHRFTRLSTRFGVAPISQVRE